MATENCHGQVEDDDGVDIYDELHMHPLVMSLKNEVQYLKAQLHATKHMCDMLQVFAMKDMRKRRIRKKKNDERKDG